MLREIASHITGRKWDNVGRSTITRNNWWHSERIVTHYNYRLCGRKVSGPSHGCRHRLRTLFPGRTFERAVSVACGNATKELLLVDEGLVDTIDLYELSSVMVQKGNKEIRRSGYEAKMRYLEKSPFDEKWIPKYDLVYWDHALHHMFDVDLAVQWSISVLADGGVFLLNDYVGPNRLQWSRKNVAFCNAILSLMDDAYFSGRRKCVRNSNLFTRLRTYLRDPSEAAQSSRIIPACMKYMPGIDITPIGGAVYGVCANLFMTTTDEADTLIDFILHADDFCLYNGLYLYAFGIFENHRHESAR